MNVVELVVERDEPVAHELQDQRDGVRLGHAADRDSARRSPTACAMPTSAYPERLLPFGVARARARSRARRPCRTGRTRASSRWRSACCRASCRRRSRRASDGRAETGEEETAAAIEVMRKNPIGRDAVTDNRRPMLALPRVTLCCIDCANHDLALAALQQCVRKCALRARAVRHRPRPRDRRRRLRAHPAARSRARRTRAS